MKEENNGWGSFLGDYFGKHKRAKVEQKEINTNFYKFEQSFYNEEKPKDDEEFLDLIDPVHDESEVVDVIVKIPGTIDHIDIKGTLSADGEFKIEDETVKPIPEKSLEEQKEDLQKTQQDFLNEIEEFRKLNPHLFKSEEELEKSSDKVEAKVNKVKVSKPKAQKPKTTKPVKKAEKKTTKK